MSAEMSKAELREHAKSELARLKLSYEQLRDLAQHGLLNEEEQAVWQLICDTTRQA